MADIRIFTVLVRYRYIVETNRSTRTVTFEIIFITKNYSVPVLNNV